MQEITIKSRWIKENKNVIIIDSRTKIALTYRYISKQNKKKEKEKRNFVKTINKIFKKKKRKTIVKKNLSLPMFY